MIILKMPAYSTAGCLVLILNILRESFLQSPTSTIFTCALPITSKPIDGTAEKLAWQAWVELPQDQKKQEKTRKVTPKSIFTLPVRSCPIGYKELESRCKNDCVPGHHIQSLCVRDCPLGYTTDNLRCILECSSDQQSEDCKFSINPEELIKLELDFIAGTNLNEYDYDEEDTQTDFINQQMSAESGQDHLNSTPQKTSLDEPLKFNIFEQKFPTDYGNDGTVIEDEILDFDNNNHTLHVASTLPTPNIDETSYNLNITKSMSIFSKNLNNTKNTHSKESLRLESTDHPDLPGIIDIISVPTVVEPTASPRIEENEHYLLINDDSSIQIIQSAITPKNERKRLYPTLQEEIHQLFKDDQLLPVKNVNVFTINQEQDMNFTTNITTDTFSEQSFVESSSAIILFDNIQLQNASSKNTDASKPKEIQKSDNVKTENQSIKNEYIRSLTASKLSPKVSMQTPELDFTTTEPESITNPQLAESTKTVVYKTPTTLLHDAVSEYPLSAFGILKFNERETHTVQKKANVKPVDKKEEPTNVTLMNNSASAAETRKEASLTPLIPLEKNTVSTTQLTTTLPKLYQQQDDRFYYENSPVILSQNEGNVVTQRETPNNEADIIKFLNENEKMADSTKSVTVSSYNPPTTYADVKKTGERNAELRIINELDNIKRILSKSTTATSHNSTKFKSLNETSNFSDINLLQTSAAPYTSSQGLRTIVENEYPSSRITAEAMSTQESQTKISLWPKKILSFNRSLNMTEMSGTLKKSSNASSTNVAIARNLPNSKIGMNKTILPSVVNERISANQVLNEEINDIIASAEQTPTTIDHSPTFDPFWWLPFGWQLDSTPETQNDSTPFFFKFRSAFPDQNSRKTKTPK